MSIGSLPLFFVVVIAAATADIPPPFSEPCRHGLYPPSDSPAIPTYEVNLDLPPAKRWARLATDKAAEIKDLIGVIKNLVNSFSGQIVIDLVDRYNCAIHLIKDLYA